ncbi:hypothetical protein EDB89DRAFT_2241658 [Lactarius sanguifluus]|nr:hypothetical protein EDB89DRAFT_2241658 [Lactarius sanguifluus]
MALFDDDGQPRAPRPSRHQLWTRDGSLTVVVVIIVIIVNGEATTATRSDEDKVQSGMLGRSMNQLSQELMPYSRALLRYLDPSISVTANILATTVMMTMATTSTVRKQRRRQPQRWYDHDHHEAMVVTACNGPITVGATCFGGWVSTIVTRATYFLPLPDGSSSTSSRLVPPEASAIREPRHSNDDASHGRRGGYLTSAPSDPNCDGPNAVTNNLDLDDQAIPGRGGRATTTTRVAGWLVKASDEDATTTTMRRLGDGLAGRSLHKEHKYNSRKPEAFHAWKGHVTILSAYKTVFSDASLLLPHLPSRFFHHLRAPSTAKSSPKKGNTLI